MTLSNFKRVMWGGKYVREILGQSLGGTLALQIHAQSVFYHSEFTANFVFIVGYEPRNTS